MIENFQEFRYLFRENFKPVCLEIFDLLIGSQHESPFLWVSVQLRPQSAVAEPSQ
jgi:hypothetical protein